MNEGIYHLKNSQNEECFEYKGQQFIYMPTNDNFVCLTTERNITFMKIIVLRILPMAHLIIHQNILFNCTYTWI